MDPAPGPLRAGSLAEVAREWARIGLTGFGGPPAHIALLRRLVVGRREWLDAREFEDANAACSILPGPTSTELAIFSAHRVAGPGGAIVGGLAFITPAVVLVLALSALFLAHAPPLWVRGAGAGASAAVAAVAVQAARALIGPSVARVRHDSERRIRWFVYLGLGTAAAPLTGSFLVLVLLACGVAEWLFQARPWRRIGDQLAGGGLLLLPASVSAGGFGALAWTAFKVGALSFGGGFVIIPLMQTDAVHTYHWMSNSQFLNGVALGQVTPGPVVATVAAVGYAAHGLAGGVVAATIAFIPSFSFVLIGGRRFERLRANAGARAFLDGAGPAAIGAILGAAITLAGALHEPWQFAILAVATVVLLALNRGVVQVLVGAGVVGVVVALAGGALP
ncbi:MAG TPA: chromate efflux transporter [Solirubrobacteraceae bacterium]|jgi:chromate transporter